MRRVLRLGGSRAQLAREVDEELAFHLDARIAQLVASGMPSDAARQEALRQFGNVESVRQYCVTMDQDRERAMRRANVLDELRQDLAYAGRMLRRDLGFTAVVVLTLALGIGANSAIFTLVDAVLLKPLPVREPERLIALGDPTRTGSLSQSDVARTDLFSYPLYKDVRDGNALVTGLLASGRTPRLDVMIERGSTTKEHPRGRFVSGNYFRVLGVPAAVGRTFDESEDRAVGGSPVVVISDGWWTRRFERDPRVVGRDIVINGLTFTIIGVTPPSFTGEIVGRQNDVWIPITMQPAMMPNQPWPRSRSRRTGSSAGPNRTRHSRFRASPAARGGSHVDDGRARGARRERDRGRADPRDPRGARGAARGAQTGVSGSERHGGQDDRIETG